MTVEKHNLLSSNRPFPSFPQVQCACIGSSSRPVLRPEKALLPWRRRHSLLPVVIAAATVHHRVHLLHAAVMLDPPLTPARPVHAHALDLDPERRPPPTPELRRTAASSSSTTCCSEASTSCATWPSRPPPRGSSIILASLARNPASSSKRSGMQEGPPSSSCGPSCSGGPKSPTSGARPKLTASASLTSVEREVQSIPPPASRQLPTSSGTQGGSSASFLPSWSSFTTGKTCSPPQAPLVRFACLYSCPLVDPAPWLSQQPSSRPSRPFPRTCSESMLCPSLINLRCRQHPRRPRGQCQPGPSYAETSVSSF